VQVHYREGISAKRKTMNAKQGSQRKSLAHKSIFYTFIAKPVFYRCRNRRQAELFIDGRKELLAGKGLNESVYIK